MARGLLQSASPPPRVHEESQNTTFSRKGRQMKQRHERGHMKDKQNKTRPGIRNNGISYVRSQPLLSQAGKNHCLRLGLVCVSRCTLQHQTRPRQKKKWILKAELGPKSTGPSPTAAMMAVMGGTGGCSFPCPPAGARSRQ
jgi:hypothetical protein